MMVLSPIGKGTGLSHVRKLTNTTLKIQINEEIPLLKSLNSTSPRIHEDDTVALLKTGTSPCFGDKNAKHWKY